MEEKWRGRERKEGIIFFLFLISPVEAVSVTGWETVKEEELSFEATPTRKEDVNVDTSHLPLQEDPDGNQFIRFYWLDAYEDSFSQPGVVYLFGKIWIQEADTHVRLVRHVTITWCY